MRPRVILADDHQMVAEGLGKLICEVADLVGQVRDGRQLVEATRRLAPDVVVSDITMPEMSGLDALRQLKAENSTARFVFVTVHADPRIAADAVRSGASGYLLKAAAGEELLEAIRAVMAGRVYLSPYVTREVLQILSQPAGQETPPLTLRQQDVLRLIAKGKRMKEIAAQLNISVRTVEDHKARLLQTLGLDSTAELVRYAVKEGMLAD